MLTSHPADGSSVTAAVMREFPLEEKLSAPGFAFLITHEAQLVSQWGLHTGIA